MRQCGFRAVLLGLESGSEKILRNMNKRATPSEYLRGINILRNHGILTFGAVMVGFPGEDETTISETRDFLNGSGLDFCYLQPFYYLHNSPIHGLREQFKLEGERAYVEARHHELHAMHGGA